MICKKFLLNTVFSLSLLVPQFYAYAMDRQDDNQGYRSESPRCASPQPEKAQYRDETNDTQAPIVLSSQHSSAPGMPPCVLDHDDVKILIALHLVGINLAAYNELVSGTGHAQQLQLQNVRDLLSLRIVSKEWKETLNPLISIVASQQTSLLCTRLNVPEEHPLRQLQALEQLLHLRFIDSLGEIYETEKDSLDLNIHFFEATEAERPRNSMQEKPKSVYVGTCRLLTTLDGLLNLRNQDGAMNLKQALITLFNKKSWPYKHKLSCCPDPKERYRSTKQLPLRDIESNLIRFWNLLRDDNVRRSKIECLSKFHDTQTEATKPLLGRSNEPSIIAIDANTLQDLRTMDIPTLRRHLGDTKKRQTEDLNYLSLVSGFYNNSALTTSTLESFLDYLNRSASGILSNAGAEEYRNLRTQLRSILLNVAYGHFFEKYKEVDEDSLPGFLEAFSYNPLIRELLKHEEAVQQIYPEDMETSERLARAQTDLQNYYQDLQVTLAQRHLPFNEAVSRLLQEVQSTQTEAREAAFPFYFEAKRGFTRSIELARVPTSARDGHNYRL